MHVDPICSLVLDTDVHRPRIQIATGETASWSPALLTRLPEKLIFLFASVLKRNKAYPTDVCVCVCVRATRDLQAWRIYRNWNLKDRYIV